LGLGITVRIPIGRLRRYLKENLGAPFVICFMVLLLAAALLLVNGAERAANEVAVYAYYSLVIGVVLQLVCFLKYGGGEGS
jgi:heme/copper-type cytochrome/quinol oxidase subunit 4